MKNLLFFLFLFPVLTFSQDMDEQTTVENDATKSEIPYDRFSIELNVGANRTDGYYSPGFYQVDAENDLAMNGISRVDLGFRYMLNEKFGLKFSAAYDMFESYSNVSTDFDTNLLRFNFEGVVNLRNILDFDSFTKRFGLLGHAGVHYGFFGDGDTSGDGGDAIIGGTDEVAGFIIGFTPQYRLSHTFALTLDASFVKNYRQHRTWDYNLAPKESNLNAEFMTFSLGITAYIGKKEMHADWYVVDDEMMSNPLEDRIKQLEDEIKKTNDRITPHPDPLASPAIADYINKYVDDKLENFDVVEALIKDEYFRVFFDFDIDIPNDQSHDDISTLINFMKRNPDQRIEVIGLTDVLGTNNYNDDLSQRRAKNVKDILVAAGIDESRIENRGGGKNPEYTSKNQEIRRMARTAIVKLLN